MSTEAPITALIPERPHQPGNQRWMISGSFGTDFLLLLEQTPKIFHELPWIAKTQILDAKGALNKRAIRKPIFLIGDDSERLASTLIRWGKLPRFLLGAKIGEESTIILKKIETSEDVLLLMAQQLGLPQGKIDIGWIKDTIVDFRNETLVLVTNFHLLLPKEQQKLLRFLNQLGQVPKIIATDILMETWTVKARKFIGELKEELANSDYISGAGHN